MNDQRWLIASERWFRFLLWLYPPDFRDEMGEAVVEAYRDRCHTALRAGGPLSLVPVWLRALLDSARNGLGERVRPAVSWRRTGNWGRDMERATRRLVRAPVFTAATVGTLTVGLGAFAVVYTAVHQVLLAPMPYERPDDLHFVWRDYGPIFDLDRGWLGGTDVAELQKAGGVITDAAGLLRRTTTLSSREGDPTEIAVMITTPNLFELLGVRPVLGRGFVPGEVGPGRPAVAVLTHELWSRLGADSSAIGTELRLNGQPFTIVGVLPRNFAFVSNASLGPAQGADAYITFNTNLAESNPGAGSYAGLIRRSPGASSEEVAEAVAAVGRFIDERDFESRGLTLYPVGLKTDLVAGVRPALVVLGLAGGFLLLVLMANLATLLLARAGEREQEFAVSRALGANPTALVRATVIEGGLLGVLGGLAGTAVAVWGTRALVSLTPLDVPRRESIAVDWNVAAVVIGAGLLLGLLAATAPAAWAARTSLAALLSRGAVRGGGAHGRMRRGMVVLQVALSLVLLSAAGLVVRSFEGLLRAEPGFDPENVLTMRVPMPDSPMFPDDAEAVALQDRLRSELAALTGVTAVSAATALPLSAGASQITINIPGAPGNTGDVERDNPLVDLVGIRTDYLDAMGMHLLAGRAFEPARPEGLREALIDHVIASHFFPTGDPVGARIPYGQDTLTIVGVVQQARLYDVHRDDRGQLYVRAEDQSFRTLSFVVRSERDPRSLVRDVGAVVRRLDPRLALADVRTMEDIVGGSLRQQRLTTMLIAGFSLGALVLSAMGLFGVVSAAVARRRHELAVRIALGADHPRVMRLVVGEGAWLILLGAGIGVPATLVVGRALSGVLVDVSPHDPATLTAAALGLAAVALVACYLPARRISHLDPGRSLRQE